MEINIIGRHMEVPERFQRHLDGKLEKVNQLAPAATRVEVEISQEANPRRAGESDRVELTVFDDRSVIRSEARADDLYAALDIAYGKLIERLRRARDRRKDHRRGRDRAHSGPESVRHMPAADNGESVLGAPPAVEDTDAGDEQSESPVVIREKKHQAAPMTIDEALYEMELVGHDFFLFIDEETRHPKVVYRRKGWNYGVIELVGEE